MKEQKTDHTSTSEMEVTTSNQQEKISPLAHLKEAVSNESTSATERHLDVYTAYLPDRIHSYQQQNQIFLFQTENGIQLQVRVLSEHIIRFRYSFQKKFDRDFSYAIDPDFKAKEVEIQLEETAEAFWIKTAVIHCQIHKNQLLLKLFDTDGQLICEDAAPYRAISTLLHGLSEVRITHKAHESENYYGLGDKSSKLNLRGQIKQNWNTDAFAYEADRDPLYRSIPFYFGLHQGLSYGIFFDNSYRTHFDFDSKKDGKTHFYAEGGEANYYFIYDRTLTGVAEQYTQLTGTPELPPLWSLGFHQCRWSYYPEARVRALAKEFRERQIPCDAIYLDIDYMDAYRCFTWNKNHFPNPKQLISDLEEEGFQTVVMIDPGLKVDENYWVYQSGLEQEVYCNRTSGETMIGPVWPPECVFPDYTRPDVRAWWGKLYRELYVEQGISGFWNDMNEPAMFKVDRATFPDNVLHDYEGELTDHRKAHNIYGLQMTRATTEGLKKLKPEKRPFLLTRATFSGGQRFAAVWTGDNVASWEHLHIANIQCQRLSISGFSFVGSDIGGFAGTPTGELMVRWMQIGIFHPFYRIHSMGNNVDGASETNKASIEAQERLNRLDQEPWAFGAAYEALMKAAIELRYRLLPYIYTTFWNHSTQGTPMIKSLVFYDQHDPSTYDRATEFIFGAHLLVCPIEQACTAAGLILEEKEAEGLTKDLDSKMDTAKKTKAILDLTEKQEMKIIRAGEEVVEEDLLVEKEAVLLKEQEIYLPKGTWYDWENKKIYSGQQYITFPVTLEKMPIFVKAGAVIPQYPVQQYVGEKEIEQVQLDIFYLNGECKSQLYEDAGEGYGYRKGDYKLRSFHVEGNDRQFLLTQWKEGNYQESYTAFKICIHGLPSEVTLCKVDERKIPFEQVEGSNSIEIRLSKNFEELELGFNGI
ncbi:MAG: TIM-barrel domain-containing protein [Bacteroidota bacterium]